MKIWTFEDASKRLGAILDAAVTTPQIIEKAGQRFVVSITPKASNSDKDLLLRGGPLDSEDKLDN